MKTKKELRAYYKNIRKNMLDKDKKDEKILNSLKETDVYLKSNTVFVYVSSPIEVNTIALIESMLCENKTVAVPLCHTESCTMDFYKISSMSDLLPGAYGIYEPCLDKCSRAYFDKDTLCIVPGLSFDKNGYRLGFGKGYYDRFLSVFPGKSIGLCYEECIAQNLITDKYDKSVSAVITENKIYL